MSAKIEAHSSGGMTSYTIKGTPEEIQEAIDGIERRFHPMGYGTSFHPIKPDGDGEFVAYGSRSNSCD